MHFLFIPYGKRSEVELMLRDMEAQKHKLPMTKGEKRKEVWIQGQVRLLPFGVYEYVFPYEDLDIVLNTMGVKNRYKQYLGDVKTAFIRKMIKCDKIPDFKTEHQYMWIKENVNIIPIGIRHDDLDYTDDRGEHKGWTHEAI